MAYSKKRCFNPEYLQYRFNPVNAIDVCCNMSIIKEFEKLPVSAAEFKPVSESNGSQGWTDMVNRLKAGEDVPGVALVPNGNVVFLVLD